MRVGHATATQGLSGRVRIAATNALAEEVLAPRLAQLLLSNPGLVIDLLASTHTVNFSRWRRTWPSSCESRAWRLCHRAAGIDPALPFRARRRFRSRTTRGDALSPAQGTPTTGPVRDGERPGHPHHDPMPPSDRHPSRLPLPGYEERPTLPRDGTAATARGMAPHWLRSCFLRDRTTSVPQRGQ